MSDQGRRDRPIIMATDSVLALLHGTKTQTRRVIPGLWWRCLDPDDPDDRQQALLMCPYGRVGDRLWVKETWASTDPRHPRVRVAYRASMTSYGITNLTDLVTGETVADAKMFPSPVYPGQIAHWRSPLFMPRWASRLTLTITAVQAARLHDLSAADALAEGVPDVAAYQALWDRLNAKRGYPWAANPWVWCLTVQRVQEDAHG